VEASWQGHPPITCLRKLCRKQHHAAPPAVLKQKLDAIRSAWGVVIHEQSDETGRAGGGGGGRLPRPDSNAESDQAPGQNDARGVYRSGGDVTVPVVVYRTDPEYTEQARVAKYQGSVLLSVDIDPAGTPTNIKVQRGLGLGLNEKAVEAVKQWKFRPGQKDGTAVSVQTNIEVIFRL